MPAFALLLLGPASPRGARRGSPLVLLLGDVGIAVVGTLVGAHRGADPRARPDRPAARAAAAHPGGHRRRARRRRRCSRRPAQRRSRDAGWRCSRSMIWSSGCSPTRSSTSCWRTSRRCCTARASGPSRSLTAVTLTGAFALAFFYAPMDADQGFSQKIFYVHVPLAIVALCGFVARRDHGDPAPAHPRRALGPALVRRDPPVADPRRRRADHRLDLGQGVVGPLVGLGRADAGLVPDRLPALRHLPAAALLDRGPRAPGPLRVGLRGRRRRLRADQLLAVRLAEPTSTRASSPRRRRHARRDAARPSSSPSSGWRCCS